MKTTILIFIPLILLLSCKKDPGNTPINVTLSATAQYVPEPLGSATRLNIITAITPSGTGANGTCTVDFDIYSGSTFIQRSEVSGVPVPGKWIANGTVPNSTYNIQNLKIVAATSYYGTDGKTYTFSY